MPMRSIDDDDESLYSKGTLIHMPMLHSPAAMAYAISTTIKHFMDFGQSLPPIPEKVMSFIPCALHITDRAHISNGRRIGRIYFISEKDETVLSDQNWVIAEKDANDRH